MIDDLLVAGCYKSSLVIQSINITEARLQNQGLYGQSERSQKESDIQVSHSLAVVLQEIL